LRLVVADNGIDAGCVSVVREPNGEVVQLPRKTVLEADTRERPHPFTGVNAIHPASQSASAEVMLMPHGSTQTFSGSPAGAA
jgi:hypothetical protein